MMTIDGARVLGLDQTTGSLEQGKNADIILIDTNGPHIMEGGRPVPKILYSTKGSDVIISIIHGRIVMENKTVLSLDETKVMENAENMKEDLFHKAGEQTAALVESPWPEKKASWRMA
jgi:5-methylthioadenosine/S-adenosylhomocysteine deaminase